MKEIEFNLLDEKWILARKSDCTVDELSLTDALLKAHEYVELAGELPTQDVAVLRLMLAVLHTVFQDTHRTARSGRSKSRRMRRNAGRSFGPPVGCPKSR